MRHLLGSFSRSLGGQCGCEIEDNTLGQHCEARRVEMQYRRRKELVMFVKIYKARPTRDTMKGGDSMFISLGIYQPIFSGTVLYNVI